MRLNRGQLLVIGLFIGVIVVAAVYVVLSNPLLSQSYVISTGRETGIYYANGQRYAERIAENGVVLDVLPGAGSIETLQRLIADEADIGFVQGGTTSDVDTSELESLGSMYYEPVWIFHRAGLEIEYLSDLAGRTVSVGEEGSGVLPLATELLSVNNVTTENTSFVNMGSADATEALRSGEIDAAFFVVSPQSALVFDLLQDEAVQPLSLARAAAYPSRFPYLTNRVLPQGALDLSANIPAEDINLLTTTATLVVRRDTPEDLILLLLPYLVEIHRQPGILETPEEFPTTRFTELPINAAADRYYKQGPTFFSRYLPPVWASVADRLVILAIPLITLLYPIFRGVPPVYRFGIRYTIIRWYVRLREIDEGAESLSTEKLRERMREVEALETDIFKQTNVPDGYLDELYGLVEHIGLVHDRLEKIYNRRVLTERETTR